MKDSEEIAKGMDTTQLDKEIVFTPKLLLYVFFLKWPTSRQLCFGFPYYVYQEKPQIVSLDLK